MVKKDVQQPCLIYFVVRSTIVANMRYCRFENTYNDLRDCLEALDNEGGITGVEEDANDYEKPYVRRLIDLCQEIVSNYGDELEELVFRTNHVSS